MIERWTIISIVLMIDANNSFVLHDIELTLAKSIELSEYQDNNCNCWMTIEEILLAMLIPCKYFNQSFESQFTKFTLIVVFIVNYCKYSLSLDSKASWMTINWKLVELIVFEQQIKLNSACDPSRVECKSSTVRWIPANRHIRLHRVGNDFTVKNSTTQRIFKLSLLWMLFTTWNLLYSSTYRIWITIKVNFTIALALTQVINSNSNDKAVNKLADRV